MQNTKTFQISCYLPCFDKNKIFKKGCLKVNFWDNYKRETRCDSKFNWGSRNTLNSMTAGWFLSFSVSSFSFCVSRLTLQDSHLEKERSCIIYRSQIARIAKLWNTANIMILFALDPKLNWCFICIRKRRYRSRLSIVIEVTGGIKNEHKVNYFLDIFELKICNFFPFLLFWQ